MFDEGEAGWPENPPFHAPIFVVTHQTREPWVRKGGTSFTFVTEGVQSALEQARVAAGDLDVRVSGGANIIRQFIKAGLVDDLGIHLAPILLGNGVRLFDRIAAEDVALETMEVIASPSVTHLAFRLAR